MNKAERRAAYSKPLHNGRFPIQSATITRTYAGGDIVSKRITLNGTPGPDPAPYAVGDVLGAEHVWHGFRITAIVDC